MLLIFSRLALLPHDFDFKQTQEILFDFFPRDEDEIGKIFFLPHTGGGILPGRRRIHGSKRPFFSMLNETLIIIKQNFLIHKVVSFRARIWEREKLEAEEKPKIF